MTGVAESTFFFARGRYERTVQVGRRLVGVVTGVAATVRIRADRFVLERERPSGRTVRTDRVWFFAGLDHTTSDGAPAGYQGSDSQQEDDTRAIGKLTWDAWPSARIDGFVQGGGVYRYLTGGAWGRIFVASGLAHGNEGIRAEPRDTNRLPAINQLDLHVEKTVRLRGRTIAGYADAFNVWNQGVPDSEWGDVVIAASGPNLGVPTRWRQPRQVRIGLQLTF